MNSVSVAFNILLDWLPVVAAGPLLAHMPAGCIGLVLLSAGLYSLGVVFLCCDDRRRYFHAVWHALVVLASTGIYAGISAYVI